MVMKGQKLKQYSKELKLEAIRLHVEEKWTYRQINEHLAIQDKDRMKRWMRKSMESFFSHLKTEGLYPYDIRNLTEAQSRIEKYIRFYNRRRPQRKLNKLTPVEYRRQFAV